ncbi:Urb2/Npa2 family-domain-containing protein [Lasiosphaeria hispida]|uniref:Urb2/Npa2 family-domain-containing protein n=1 Tax=Lasiosphaeria hispida TaxID=260671 RepID=A0AAJ0MGB4_9PEZI|nr:Urb2/Npa2 family-domain-containing protein [Lasiosphaeria hispida]
MSDEVTTGEAALVRAVRALDQGDIETTPDKLERVWHTLSRQPGGTFHAAEEMLVRWLLKNMTGTKDNFERVRRYPLAWNVLGAVFSWIPLFSLAKSLADRRFVAVLQQTLKDISEPRTTPKAVTRTDGADSDVEMGDVASPASSLIPRKRKRSSSAMFILDAQRAAEGCLQSAEAVLDAIRILLSRCDLKSLDGTPSHRMGAEHIKSLFSTSAVESKDFLVPFLAICNMAVDRPEKGSFKEQSLWISNFVALWDLHLQSASDGTDVALHLGSQSLNLLGKLTGIPRPRPVGVGTAVQERWTRDLRRFLARNIIIPSKTAFLNSRSTEIIEIATDIMQHSAGIAYPVLFDLFTNSLRIFGEKASRKDYEAWLQALFDSILEKLPNIDTGRAQAAIRAVMEIAAARDVPLSISSLLATCKSYALKSSQKDWDLLLSVVKLNPDVFLIPKEGQALLDQILQLTQKPDALSRQDLIHASQFIVILADGYAKGRDLSSFIKIWLKYLAAAEPDTDSGILWGRKELANAVADLISQSLNANQLLDILDWLSEQTGHPESMAKIPILGAISAGISSEEFINVANMKVFDGIFAKKFSRKELPVAFSVARWGAAEKCLQRGTAEECGRIWTQVKPNVEHVLRKSSISKEETLAAFKCCTAAWIANHPGGVYEDEVATLTCSFIDRLEEEPESKPTLGDSKKVTKEAHMSWIISPTSRLINLLVGRNGTIPKFLLSSIIQVESGAESRSALATSSAVLDNENNATNQGPVTKLVDTVISLIQPFKGAKSTKATPSIRAAVQFLIDVPVEAINRPQREACMKQLISQLPEKGKYENDGFEYWRAVLSLMVKLMGSSTFYEDMSFSHLETIGLCILGPGWPIEHSNFSKFVMEPNRPSKDDRPRDHIREREDLKQVGELATLTLRQMTAGGLEDREKTYLAGAASHLLANTLLLPNSCLWITLARALVSAVQDAPDRKRLEEGVVDLQELKRCVLNLAEFNIETHLWHGAGIVPILTSLEAVNILEEQTIRGILYPLVPKLREASNWLLDNGSHAAGWEIHMFLAKHFTKTMVSPLKIKLPAQDPTEGDGAADQSHFSSAITKGELSEFVDVVVHGADEDTKLGHLKRLLVDGESEERDAPGRLFIIYRLLQHIKGTRTTPAASSVGFDLAQAHSILCNRLSQSNSLALFVPIVKAVHLILDQKAGCMTQWNIELTLSTVATICSVTSSVAASPKTYKWLCRLVETVIKRHRIRLDGHFHILVTTLQALLRRLLSRPQDAWSYDTGAIAKDGNKATSRDQPQTRAKLFSRLMTLVCEPTDASVSRSQAANSLGSEKDKAKRYAGQYMYLVVMQYIKLHLEQAVPHEVSKALETGMNSALDITSQDMLKLMNDAMDPSGRVIFKELYKQYHKFGKWSGV